LGTVLKPACEGEYLARGKLMTQNCEKKGNFRVATSHTAGGTFWIKKKKRGLLPRRSKGGLSIERGIVVDRTQEGRW